MNTYSLSGTESKIYRENKLSGMVAESLANSICKRYVGKYTFHRAIVKFVHIEGLFIAGDLNTVAPFTNMV